MKTINNIALTLLVTLLLVVGLGTGSLASANDFGLISVRGEGVVNLKPDLCEVSFSTIVTNKDQVKAVEENARKMDSLIKGFKDWGIAEKDIVTESIYVGPIYDYEKKPASLKNYRSENRIVVTIRDMDRIGEAIDLGIKLGANNVGYLRYGSSHGEKAYTEALEMAVKDARLKADAIGKALGVKLKAAVKVEELGGNYYRRNVNEEVGLTMAEDNAQAISTPIEVKDLEIRGELQIDFKY